MPAYKCDNGKYRWGATGSCKYDSKQEAEDDNKDYYRSLSDIDLTPNGTGDVNVNADTLVVGEGNNDAEIKKIFLLITL